MTTDVPDNPGAVVLVLHGGLEHGTARTRAYLPQVLLCRILAATVARRWRRTEGAPAAAFYRLQFAWTGWDGDGRDALTDHAWALAELRRRHPGVPIAVLGHSMGGRIGVRLAADRAVVGVVGLAPWLPVEDPVAHLTEARLSVVHGTRDRELPPESTAGFLTRARDAGMRIRQLEVIGGGHSLLRHYRRWNQLAAEELMLLVRDQG